MSDISEHPIWQEYKGFIGQSIDLTNNPVIMERVRALLYTTIGIELLEQHANEAGWRHD